MRKRIRVFVAALASPALFAGLFPVLFVGLFAGRASADARDSAAPQAQASSAPTSDAAAIEAYRAGDLEAARNLWLSALEADSAASPGASPSANIGASHAARAKRGEITEPKLSAEERARLCYNLGNVSFRKKRVLEAVGWYSAALRLSPRDPDTWWNLEHARSEAKLEPADRGDLSGTLRRLVTSLTVAEREWLVLAMLLAWAGVLAGEALRGGRIWRRLSWAGAVLVALSFGPWLYHLARSGEHPVLAIQEGKLEIKSEPRADAAAIAEVSAGDELAELDALPEWTKVELPNGVQGWARKSALFDLDR